MNQEQEQPNTTPSLKGTIRSVPEVREPRIADRVLVDVEWTPISPKEPNPTLKGRIIGIDMEGNFYISLSPHGIRQYFNPKAVKLDQ